MDSDVNALQATRHEYMPLHTFDLLKFMRRKQVYDHKKYFECGSRPDNLTVLTQFRYFIINK